MALVAAVALDDGTVWMGGDRIAGGMDYHELAGPKVFDLKTGDDVPYLLGFAGSPRVAQAVLATPPPDRTAAERSLHWWLTEYCDAIHDRLADRGLIRDGGDDEPFLACHTGALLAVEGQVVLIGRDLSWEITTRGWRAIGVAFETFNGAYSALRGLGGTPVVAARDAWPIVQQFHRIGDLVDELSLPK